MHNRKSNPYMVHCVPTEMLDDAWPLVEDWILAGMARAEPLGDIQQVREEIRQTRMQLWVVQAGQYLCAAFTTRVQQCPDASYVECLHVGGQRVEEWLTLAVETVEEWATDAGAQYAKLRGRKGWQRKMAPLGYVPESVTLRKKLRDVREAH